MPSQVAIVCDCGSTNITVTAVDPTGRIVASAGRANESVPQPGKPPGWIIWDLDALFERISAACRELTAQLGDAQIVAVTVDTWGADGAPVRSDGSLCYPLICWQDSRTEGLVARIKEEGRGWRFFETTGYQVIPFNTLLRLIWLRENEPAALDDASCWMMTAGLLSHRLCGEMSIDPTAAGTMMAMDMARRDWSPQILAEASVAPSFFPRWTEPGQVIGRVHAAASAVTGIPIGTPVVAAGHDTQFAAVGCGGRPGEAILSSGTWEILMLRHDRFSPTPGGFEEGLLYECDAEPGLWNPQLLMMGSGVLEWLRDGFFADLAGRSDVYDVMISEARVFEAGAGGVTVLPSFVAEAGPSKKHGTKGTILGLEITTVRGQLYRAALEGLSFQLRHALEVLAASTGFEPKGIRAVGGGSRNALWNQIRADVTGLPITITEQKEATALGAAMFAFVGAGVFSAVSEAQSAMSVGESTVEPGPDAAAYADLYAAYRALLPSLESHYR
jgi:L-fuculokinase